LLYAECAALNYRVGQVDEAIHYAEQAIKTDSKFPDAYRILGVCLNEKGNKQKAREYLKKAIELGDTLAQGVLDKMK
jgi:tetratricopeptide (TPR) repeat protein